MCVRDHARVGEEHKVPTALPTGHDIHGLLSLESPSITLQQGARVYHFQHHPGASEVDSSTAATGRFGTTKQTFVTVTRYMLYTCLYMYAVLKD